MNEIERERILKDPRYPPLGSIIANCKISSIIGIGGVAVVYEAFEIDLEIQRAIKILKPDSIDYLRKKFETEAKVTARLDHPNIVKVHGSGIYDGRLPFIHMEYVNGKTLRQLLLALSTIPPAVSISIISTIASTLEFAYSKSFSIWGNHSEKLIHRDLKPENIIIANDGTLKVMDFGLAQFKDDKRQGGWGTPAYMSPEQLDHQPADLRNDHFSLGIILYEMLCGVRPFPDDEQKMEQYKKEGKFSSVHTHNPSIPQSVCNIVSKCLQPNIEERYRTYESLRTFSAKALSEITLRSSQDILKSFMENPSEFHIIELPRTPEKLKIPYKKIGISLLTVTTLITILVILLNLNFFNNLKLSQKNINDFKPKEPLTNESLSIQNTVHTKNIQAQIPKTAQSQAETIDPKKQFPDLKKNMPKISEPSILSDAIQYWSNKNYSATIAFVNNLNLDTLQKRTRDSAIIILSDALYQSHLIPEVLELATKYDINDALYYTILAYSNEILLNQQIASGLIDKAILAPITIGKISRNNLLFDRALFYKRYYDKVKDEPSKRNMLEAFRRFVNESCPRNSNRCDEAKLILKNYE